MGKPERTPAEEWAFFRDWLRGLLGRSMSDAKKFYPQKLSADKLAEEARATDAIMASGDELLSEMREFYARMNGKPTPPKEAKK